MSHFYSEVGEKSPYLFHCIGWSIKLNYFDIVRCLVANHIKKIKANSSCWQERQNNMRKSSKFKIKVFIGPLIYNYYLLDA